MHIFHQQRWRVVSAVNRSEGLTISVKCASGLGDSVEWLLSCVTVCTCGSALVSAGGSGDSSEWLVLAVSGAMRHGLASIAGVTPLYFSTFLLSTARKHTPTVQCVCKLSCDHITGICVHAPMCLIVSVSKKWVLRTNPGGICSQTTRWCYGTMRCWATQVLLVLNTRTTIIPVKDNNCIITTSAWCFEYVHPSLGRRNGQND